jgi:hypothetical protein
MLSFTLMAFLEFPGVRLHVAANADADPRPRQRNRRNQIPALYLVARRPYQEPRGRHDLGRMDVPCQHCGALHWFAEKTVKSPARAPKFGMCCDHGKVRLPPLREPPEALRALYTGNDPQAQEFRNNIRQYNMALAFTSVGVHEDIGINRRGGWIFRILGQLSHYSGALLPPEGCPPSYAQLYLYDPGIALRQRLQRNPNLRQDTMTLLQNLLTASHPYAAIYKHAHEVLAAAGDVPNATVTLRVSHTTGLNR